MKNKSVRRVIGVLAALTVTCATLAACSVEAPADDSAAVKEESGAADTGKAAGTEDAAGADAADQNDLSGRSDSAEQSGTAGQEGSADASIREQIVIGVAPKMVGAPYWEYANEGCLLAGEELGPNVKVELQASTTASAAEQASIIDNFITMGVDALVVSANDESTLLPVLNRASEKGIPIITYDSDVPDSKRLYCVAGTGQVELGEIMAEQLVEVMGEEGQVAFMTGSLGAFNHNQILEGYKNVLGKHSGIEVVTTVESGDDQQQAFVNAENLMASYPDLKGILGVAAGETPAAAEAVAQAGKSGQTKIVGAATPNSVKQYYEDGTLERTVLWDPKAMGYIAVKVAVDYLNGIEPEEGQVLYEGGSPVTIDEDHNIYIGTTTFTKDNINDFDF